jgi:hypothetical protein
VLRRARLIAVLWNLNSLYTGVEIPAMENDMDQRKLALLEALKFGAQAGGEIPLYRRGKSPGLFAQRTRIAAEIASQAVADGLLETARVEANGKASIEWMRVTPKGFKFLLDSESPARALDELREALAANQQGLPKWAAELRGRIDELATQMASEVAAMRERLEQMSKTVADAIERLEEQKTHGPAAFVPWGHETLDLLARRRQVGLGTRCPLAELYAALKEHYPELTIKDFHAGLRQLRASKAIALLTGNDADDTPGPECALLDGASVYYYVAQAGTSPSE